MMKYFTSIILLSVFTVFPAGNVTAQTSGLDFLTVGPNTFSLGINEASTAALIGASALYTNPANLVLEPSSSVTGSHSLWIADLQNSHLAVNLNNRQRAIAFGLLTSRADDFEARTRAGPSEGTFTVSYLSVAASYAHRLGPISIGGTVQYLREEYFVNNASGYAFNAGISGELVNRRIRVSGALQNAGKMNKLVTEETKLPANIKIGIWGKLFEMVLPGRESPTLDISVLGDYIQPVESGIDDEFVSYSPGDGFYNIGLMVDVAEVVSLRAGYKTGDTVRRTSFGAGIMIDALRFDYALVPFSTGFGTVHSIGLSYYF